MVALLPPPRSWVCCSGPLGTISPTRDQWLIAIGLAFALVLIDEVMRFFLHRRRSAREGGS